MLPPFETFWHKVRIRFYKDYRKFLWEQVLIAVSLAAGTLFLQYRKGMIARAAVHDNAVVLFAPYLLIAAGFVLYHFIVSLYQVGKESHDTLQEASVGNRNMQGWGELSRRRVELQDEIADLKNEMRIKGLFGFQGRGIFSLLANQTMSLQEQIDNRERELKRIEESMEIR